VKSVFCLGLAAAIAIPAPVASAQAFETVSLDATSRYNGKNVTLRGELLRPSGAGPFPAVILMHGCGGWQPSAHQALREHARHLVDNGFVALNLDSFEPRRISGGWVCKDHSRLAAARVYRQVDAFDAMKFLRGRTFVDPENIFAMGQSNGGSVVALLAQNNASILHGERVFSGKPPSFRALAAFYPWCGTLSDAGVAYGGLVSPLYVFAGEKDDWTPPKGCRIKNLPGADYQFIVYPDALHSFDLNVRERRYLGHLVGFNSHATFDSRKRMVAFFRAHLIGN